MSRSFFNFLAAIVWIVYLAGSYFMWPALNETASGWWDGPSMILAGAAIAVGAFLVWQILGHLSLHMTQLAAPSRKAMTPEQAQAQALKDSARAVKEGRAEDAVQILERANLLLKALEVAEQMHERSAMARILRRLGRHARARQLYIEQGELESAAHASVLMEEIADARELYRQAAQACADQGALGPHEAGLWDRAGDREKAARVYERCGELELAAECLRLMGDDKTAARVADQAKALKALEARQRAIVDRRIEDRRIETEKAANAQRAAQLEQVGDLYGAGILYRKADKWMEAAIAFERFEEWQRAAEAYEKAGLPDRAEIVRMKAPASTAPGEEDEAGRKGDDFTAPPPSAAPPPTFHPLIAAAPVPIHLARAGAVSVDPQLQIEVAKRVRRGNFLEAAELAKTSNDWLMAAAYYEHASEFLTAADLYRQIGNPISAAWCLNRAGRPLDAAQMLFADGEYARGVETLAEAIQAGKDGNEPALMLSEFLARRGHAGLALGLLRRLIAPEGPNEHTAKTYYQFGLLLEDAGAWAEAGELFRELIEAGAESDNLRKRSEEAASKAGSSNTMAPDAGKRDGREWKDIVAQVENLISGAAGAAPSTTRQTGDAASRTPFVFQPEETEAPAGGGGTVLLDAPQVSLFGIEGVATTKGMAAAISGNRAAMQGGTDGMEAEADPFRARRQRFERSREVARGGMGIVYEAVDTSLGRKVALKLLQPEMIGRIGLKQFLLEARAIAMLSHPNIVVIYDIGMMDFRHYLAMEFLGGGSLAGLIRQERGLPLKDGVRIFIEMCRGAQAAHEAGIIHRDIKPENALLTERMQVKLVDFGLAMPSEDDEQSGLAEFRLSGTPGFMAPEQYRGERLLPRCDIFALGMTLQCMLLGEAPHQTAARMGFQDVRKFQEAPNRPSLRDLVQTAPAVLDQIHAYCVAPDPEERYPNIEAFLPTVEKLYATL